MVSLFACNKQSGAPTEHPNSKSPTIPSLKSMDLSDVFVYECGDSLRFTAYVTEDSTWLYLPDTTVKVTPVPSGSGARYEGNSYLYWSKGKKALLQLPKGGLKNCQNIPREASWQAAKIRGVDFRALGQEPGWILEIKKGNQIKYIGRYGKDTLVADYRKPTNDGDRQTVYSIKEYNMTIKIIDKPCRAAMSGFKFPSTVMVSVGRQKFQGCGETLN